MEFSVRASRSVVTWSGVEAAIAGMSGVNCGHHGLRTAEAEMVEWRHHDVVRQVCDAATAQGQGSGSALVGLVQAEKRGRVPSSR